MNTEAFVYCWTDHATNKLYVGWHKGSFDDGYICSSKFMKEQYDKRPNDFSRQIVAAGTMKEMLSLESTILNAANARDDDVYYNLHNGNGFYRSGPHSEETKQKISKKLLGKSYLTEEGRRKKSEYNKKNPPKRGAKESDQAKANKKIAFAKSEKHGANFKNKSPELCKRISKGKRGKMTGEDNVMSDPANRKKVAESKIGLKKLTKSDSKGYKMAREGTEKWDSLIKMGYVPLGDK